MKAFAGRLTAWMLALVLLLTSLSGCGAKQEDIIILYTNDVHCGIEDNIGYAGLASYVAYAETLTPHVTLVDCGDAIQGDLVGTVSQGGYIVELMNSLGYDLAVLGNHEFDYGMERLCALIDTADATYIGANITYSGKDTNLLEAVEPYEIIDYGKTEVAFIGVTTPWSVTSSTPAYFMDESGEFVYGFTSDSAEAFYACIQSYIDECRAEGADYVILCTHLGETEVYAPFSSVDVIEHTNGVDAVLDGHEHSVIPCRVEYNKDGEEVLLSSTGTKLANIGQLVISANGTVTTGLISYYTAKDAATESLIAQMKSDYEAEMNRVVATSDTELTRFEDGIRMVRIRETAIGDLCADAYRSISGADIAVVNGGGIRADLPAGDITYADAIAVFPFGNSLCMVEATGQEILDMLEMSYRLVDVQTAENGSAYGESGGFLQVSGLKLTVDTSVPSSVEVDENGLFASVGQTRRVRDVYVLNGAGEYEPLDVNGTYTLAAHNYMIKGSGDGYTMFTEHELLIDEGVTDYQILINYLLKIGGQLSQYREVGDRITVK